MNEVRGPTSYQNLRTIEDFDHPTFKSAAVARGLLQDDDEWERYLENAKLNCIPSQLRALFAILLVYANIKNPIKPFYTFLLSMS